MEYLQKPPSRPEIDLMEVVKKHTTELSKMVNATTRFFNGYPENLPKDKIYVRFMGFKHVEIGGGLYLFIRMEVEQYSRKGHSVIEIPSKQLLKELLEEIGLKRLYDEDGCNGIFVKALEDNFGAEDHAYCYVNPFIPEGYWENHILETSYRNL